MQRKRIEPKDNRTKRGLFDPLRQGYPGQPMPPEGEPDALDPLEAGRHEDTEPWFSREPSWHGRDARRCREYLDSLSDEQIIEEYNRMRDTKVPWGGSYYYPNIKTLFMTPFEREKDRREITSGRRITVRVRLPSGTKRPRPNPGFGGSTTIW